jgi:hypothetical protein
MRNVLLGTALVIGCTLLGGALVYLPLLALARFNIYFFAEGVFLFPLTVLSSLLGFMFGLFLAVKFAQD